jgi:hypothetical protein
VHRQVQRHAAQRAVLKPEQRDRQPRPNRIISAELRNVAREGVVREEDGELEDGQGARVRRGLEHLAEAGQVAPDFAVRQAYGELLQRRQLAQVEGPWKAHAIARLRVCQLYRIRLRCFEAAEVGGRGLGAPSQQRHLMNLSFCEWAFINSHADSVLARDTVRTFR